MCPETNQAAALGASTHERKKCHVVRLL